MSPLLQKLPRPMIEEERQEILLYCRDLYGLPEDLFDDLEFVKRKEDVWICPTGTFKGFFKEGNGEPPESFGLRALSGKSFPYKVTHSFGQLFFNHMTKRKIACSEDEAKEVIFRGSFKRGEDYPLGYYVAHFEDQFLGIILKTEEHFKSQVPKSFTAQIPRQLKFEV